VLSNRNRLWKAMVLCRIHAGRTHFVNFLPIPRPWLGRFEIHPPDQHRELFL
jgi:hypothetical protein